MLIKILVGLAAVIVVLLIVIAMQPADFTITRSTTINAPAQVIFDQVNDFRNWGAWSPWEKVDPDLKRTFAGTPVGVGTTYSWAGNSNVGEGRMTITDSRPAERIAIKLEFIKPMANVCDTLFTFTPSGNQTTVTWTMFGKKNFMAKGFHLFVNMDKMIGGQFAQGLEQMKSVAESSAKITAAN